MCQKIVYQTFYDLHQMQDELLNLRELKDKQKQNKISLPKNSEETKDTNTSKEEYKIHKDHFSKVGKILSTVDPEHDRDELCWVGDKQVSINGELSKLLQTWASTNQEVKKVQKEHDLTKEDALYKEFFDNANKVTVALIGAAGKAAYLFIKNDGKNGDIVNYEEVDIEEMRRETNAKKQVGR